MQYQERPEYEGPTDLAPRLDPDLLNALMLAAKGIVGAPTDGMPAWEYDALAFAQANDLRLFANTDEAFTVATVGVQADGFHFGWL